MIQERKKAIILRIMAASLWSTGGFLVKLVEWNPLAIAGVRSAFAAIFPNFFIGKDESIHLTTALGFAPMYFSIR